MKRFPFYFPALLLSLFCLLMSCKTENPEPELEIPATYAFSRDGQSTVDFEGQVQRLDMLGEMSSLLQSTRSLDAAIDPAQLIAMYGNTAGANFSGSFSKDLKSKTFAADTSFFLTWMEKAGAASQLGQEAAEGQAGFLSETYGSGTPANNSHEGYLVDENGVEYHQIIEKGLMGAVFFYQAMEVYLSQDRMGELGNDAAEEAKAYTAMEHYFDEAFGYFGAAVDYPTTPDGVRFWGNYCEARNSGTGSFDHPGIGAELMTAFRTGRAAIAAKEYTTRNEAIQDITEQWAIVIGATAADYLEKSKNSQQPPLYKKHHTLSEAIAFMMSLKYHFEGGNSKFAPSHDFAKVQEALDLIGPETNLWQLDDATIQQCQDLLISAFPTGTIRA